MIVVITMSETDPRGMLIDLDLASCRVVTQETQAILESANGAIVYRFVSNNDAAYGVSKHPVLLN